MHQLCRTQMLERLGEILPQHLNLTKLCKTIIGGVGQTEIDTVIFRTVATYIINAKRFDYLPDD